MTNATESPPERAAPLDLVGLAERAADIAEHLTAVSTAHGLTDGALAGDMLGVSRAGLLDAMARGQVDGLIVGGRVTVVAEQVQLRLLRHARDGAARTAATRAIVRAALTAFLAAQPVTDRWDIANADRRPLVCARRGSRFVHYGLHYHSVAMRPSWLGEWVTLDAIRESHPELASLPVGPALTDAVMALPGIAAISYVTPLASGSAPHRLSGWVRVDPREWAMNVPGPIAAAVAGPVGA